MGVYYHSLSKTVTNINGERVIRTNFVGKRPSLFDEYSQYWMAAETRGMNAAAIHKDNGETLVAYSGKLCEGNPVCKWKGAAMIHDAYIDENTIGHLRKVKGRWTIERIVK